MGQVADGIPAHLNHGKSGQVRHGSRLESRYQESHRTKRAKITDSDFKYNGDLKELLNVCDPQTEQVVNEPVFTDAEAEQRAHAILRQSISQHGDRVRDVRWTSGSACRTQRGHHRRGCSFQRQLFHYANQHSIGANGYTTQFNVRREDPDQGKQERNETHFGCHGRNRQEPAG